MPADRMEALRAMVAANPADRFAHYALAMEYVQAGKLEEAVSEFRTLVTLDPNYSFAYFHCGQTLERLDRIDKAREVYRSGIEAAARTNDTHAQRELQEALDQLG
ncbi:MAG: tetratricopeptide repeat protein [Bryobacteraceae bacterium]